MFSFHISVWPHANSDASDTRLFSMYSNSFLVFFFLRKFPKNYNLVNFVQPVKRHMFATLPKCYDLINEFDRASVLAFWCIFFSFVKRLTNLMIIMVRCLKSVQMEPKDIIWIEFCVFFSPNFQRKKKYLFINDITTILGGNRRCFQLWL